MDEVRNNIRQSNHKCLMYERSKLELTAVDDVSSFDANEIILETKQGNMIIKGKELHIEQLSLEKGNLNINGRIDLISYSDKGVNKEREASFLSRIFG